MTYAIFMDQDTRAESYIESKDAQAAYKAAHTRVRLLSRDGRDRSSTGLKFYATANRVGCMEDSGIRAVPVMANRSARGSQ